MTDPLFREFKDSLPGWAHELLDQRAVADAHVALGDGYDPTWLAEHVTYHVRGLDNAAQVMRHRLHRIAHPETDEMT